MKVIWYGFLSWSLLFISSAIAQQQTEFSQKRTSFSNQFISSFEDVCPQRTEKLLGRFVSNATNSYGSIHRSISETKVFGNNLILKESFLDVSTGGTYSSLYYKDLSNPQSAFIEVTDSGLLHVYDYEINEQGIYWQQQTRNPLPSSVYMALLGQNQRYDSHDPKIPIFEDSWDSFSHLELGSNSIDLLLVSKNTFNIYRTCSARRTAPQYWTCRKVFPPFGWSWTHNAPALLTHESLGSPQIIVSQIPFLPHFGPRKSRLQYFWGWDLNRNTLYRDLFFNGNSDTLLGNNSIHMFIRSVDPQGGVKIQTGVGRSQGGYVDLYNESELNGISDRVYVSQNYEVNGFLPFILRTTIGHNHSHYLSELRAHLPGHPEAPGLTQLPPDFLRPRIEQNRLFYHKRVMLNAKIASFLYQRTCQIF